jgi:hypothetical protein
MQQPRSILRPRFDDAELVSVRLPASMKAWLDEQKTHVLPTRTAVIRNLIARAMAASSRKG